MFSTDYNISYFYTSNKCSSCFSAIHLPPVEEGEFLLYFVKNLPPATSLTYFGIKNAGCDLASGALNILYHSFKYSFFFYNNLFLPAKDKSHKTDIRIHNQNNRNDRLDQYHIFQERHRMSHIHCACHRLL